MDEIIEQLANWINKYAKQQQEDKKNYYRYRYSGQYAKTNYIGLTHEFTVKRLVRLFRHDWLGVYY